LIIEKKDEKENIRIRIQTSKNAPFKMISQMKKYAFYRRAEDIVVNLKGSENLPN